MIGRCTTASTSRAHMPPPVGRGRPSTGTRPRSTRSPRIDSRAGRKVRLPATATAITEIVPRAIERNSVSGRMNSPATEIITARPLKKTARPAVALAVSMAARMSRPARRSERKRVTMKSE